MAVDDSGGVHRRCRYLKSVVIEDFCLYEDRCIICV